MNLEFTQEEQVFRDEVRTFLAEKLPSRISHRTRNGAVAYATRDDYVEWHRILNKRGWLALNWPKELGGTGWTPIQKFIFNHECALAGAPGIMPFGLFMLGPVLIKFGNDAQKRHWLPRILNGDDWWCQGYSEPGAGSDLASLKTTAVRDGDHYIVNGQKTWTTLGQYANMIFCLVRTNTEVRKQEGISFLLIDMKTPGVEVRPIILLEGTHEVNEVFFTDVKVPAQNLVGEENKGWTYAKYLLTFERTGNANVGACEAAITRLRRLAIERRYHGKPLIEDPLFGARLARIAIRLENMKTTNLRVLAAATSGAASGSKPSMLKIEGSEVLQELTSLARRALGPGALPAAEAAVQEHVQTEALASLASRTIAARYFNCRKLSIFAGSNEVQRSIITKMDLGL
ncbi:MAG TPA: acyl-CoA dehydrogenase family protein [Nevskiaceae bacterium]|nr:acyl-CoA dehydrogenase family protein [Nevskiaceae bacterium]